MTKPKVNVIGINPRNPEVRRNFTVMPFCFRASREDNTPSTKNWIANGIGTVIVYVENPS